MTCGAVPNVEFLRIEDGPTRPTKLGELMTEPTSSTQDEAASQRVALVTGGNRGIGREAVLALARKGVDVVFTYNTGADAAEQLIAEGREEGLGLSAVHFDVTNVEGYDDLVASLHAELAKLHAQHFDYLLNNAGVWHTASVADTTVEDLDRLYEVNIRGLFLVAQKVSPLIRDHGRIVNVSSGLVRFVFPGKAAYAMSKGAVEPFTRYLAMELAPRGITVNSIAPGATATDFSGGVIRDNPEYRDRVGAITALGRPAEPEEIGAAAAALLSDDLRWVNGERIEVSGGMRL